MRAWLHGTPAALQHALPPLDLGVLAALPPAYTTPERQQRLQSVVTVVGWVVDGLTPHLPTLDPPLRHASQSYLTALAKVQADELTRDADGWVRAHQQGARHPAARQCRRLGSEFPQTWRRPGGARLQRGHQHHSHPYPRRGRPDSATSDSDAPLAALTQQRDGGLPLPTDLVMDRAGGYGKTCARVHAVSEGQTRMTARVPQSGGSDPNRFSVADF